MWSHDFCQKYFQKQPIEVFYKKICSQKFHKIHKKMPVPEACNFIKKETLEACNFIKKETLAQVFSCKFLEISKNILFYGTPPGDCFCNFSSASSYLKCNLHTSFDLKSGRNKFCKRTVSNLQTRIHFQSHLTKLIN